MRTLERATQAITADDDGIAQDQTTAGAGNLTLNGAGVVSGAATLSPPRRVTLTSGADLSALSFTVTGLDRAGTPISEVIAGPNTNTVTTLRVFSKVTSVAVSAAAASNVRVGWGTECISGWIMLGSSWHDYTCSYEVEVTGTVNYDIEQTFRNLNRDGVTGDYSTDTTVFNAQTAKTASQNGALSPLPTHIRLKQNSGSGSARLRVVPTHSL